MNPLVIATVVFLCAFGGALLGMVLHAVLPKEHLTKETKDVVSVGMGLIATMTALLLGLVTASAKNAFDEQDGNIKHTAGKLLTLDRTLAQFGPEANEIRAQLKQVAAYRLRLTWPEEVASAAPVMVDAPDVTPTVEGIAGRIRALTPQTESQRYLLMHAMEISSQMHEARWMILGGTGESVPMPFLTIVVFWLAMIFTSFGLFAPRNATVVVVLLVCALSVAASIFLILELDDAFRGIMKVSSAPVRYAIAHLGQ